MQATHLCRARNKQKVEGCQELTALPELAAPRLTDTLFPKELDKSNKGLDRAREFIVRASIARQLKDSVQLMADNSLQVLFTLEQKLNEIRKAYFAELLALLEQGQAKAAHVVRKHGACYQCSDQCFEPLTIAGLCCVKEPCALRAEVNCLIR